MHPEDTRFDRLLFETDYYGMEQTARQYEKSESALSACVDAYLRQVSCSAESAEKLHKIASACNAFASLTRARMRFYCFEDGGNEVAFVLYHDCFVVEESDFYFLQAAVSAGASLEIGASKRFPQAAFVTVSFVTA